MDLDTFKNEIGSSSPALIYLFCPGKAPRAKNATFEPFLAERAIEQFIDATVDPGNRDFAFTAYHADETPPGTIVGEAQTLPFLAERRVILVRNAERFNSESGAGALLDYVQNPCDSTVLLLFGARMDKRTKFYKACVKSGAVVECPALTERQTIQWVREEAKERGKSIDGPAAQELVRRAGVHLSDANNALGILVDFVGEAAERITEANVVAACADVAEEEIWALTDAIASSDTGNAIRALRRLTDLGKHPDEIIGTINWLLKSAYAVAIADGEPSISRFVAQKVAPLAQKLGVRKLIAAFALCTDTQFKMRSTGANADLGLDLLVIKLAAPRSPPA